MNSFTHLWDGTCIHPLFNHSPSSPRHCLHAINRVVEATKISIPTND